MYRAQGREEEEGRGGREGVRVGGREGGKEGGRRMGEGEGGGWERGREKGGRVVYTVKAVHDLESCGFQSIITTEQKYIQVYQCMYTTHKHADVHFQYN